MKRSKNLLGIFAFLLILVGCEIDHSMSCRGDVPEGKPCGEYEYIGGKLYGYADCYYENDRQTLKEYYLKNNDLRGIEKTQYNEDGQVLSHTFTYPRKNVETYTYNEYSSGGQLIRATIRNYGEQEKIKEIIYTDRGIEGARWLQEGRLIQKEAWQFYENSDDLYRSIVSDSEGNMQYYEIHECFQNNVHRIRKYDPDGQLLLTISNCEQDNGPVYYEEISADGQVLIRRNWEYTNGRLSKLIEQKANSEKREVEYLY